MNALASRPSLPTAKTRTARAGPSLRRYVMDTLKRIAPDVGERRLDTAAPLGAQVDLDSIDWLNFFGALQDGLKVEIRPADYGRITTLDDLLAYLAARKARSRRAGIEPVEPVEPVAEHELRDGRMVTIRPLRPDDAERVQHLLEATSEEGRYSRFHKWVSAPSARLVHFLTDFDRDKCTALVCTVRAAGVEAIVGEARFIASAEPGLCEMAILVEDDWRRSGIAGLLMEALIAAARARGFRSMEGLVLANNVPMLRFARALGFDLQLRADDATSVRILKDLVPVRASARAKAARASER